jgi:hypothetical protein
LRKPSTQLRARFGEYVGGGNRFNTAPVVLREAALDLFRPRALHFGGVFVLLSVQARDQEVREARTLAGWKLQRFGLEAIDRLTHRRLTARVTIEYSIALSGV